MTPLEAVVDDAEASLFSWGSAPLYAFSWGLRGLDLGLDEDAIEAICRDAYATMIERYPLHLEWMDEWPADRGRPTEEHVELDFDTHRDAESTSLSFPVLALVPDDPAVVDRLLAPRFTGTRPAG